MSHNPELEPKKHAFRVLFGQRPLTKFKDYRQSINVELMEPEPADKMMKRIYNFVKATWSEDGREADRATPEQMQDALDQMLSGKALGLGLETINLTFAIRGITRIDTHQIVRQRIGVTFSQQCTGDRFLNHADVLVEECIAQDPVLLENYIKATLETKMSYAELNDSMKVSIQTAREITPHNLETFIFMNTNLMTLLFFYQKRIDDGSQTWPINIIAQQMADEVCKAYPQLVPVFERNKSKFKFQKEASADRKNSFSTSLYIPKVDEFEYHNRDFLYPMKKEEMNFTNTPIATKYFWGREEVSETNYNMIKDAYEKLDADNKENHFTNEELLERARQLNSELEATLQAGF